MNINTNQQDGTQGYQHQEEDKGKLHLENMQIRFQLYLFDCNVCLATQIFSFSWPIYVMLTYFISIWITTG